MGITSVAATTPFSYCHQERMDCFSFPAITATAVIPLLMAFDRDMTIDEIIIRTNVVPGATSTIQAQRIASGTADTSGTAIGAEATNSGWTADVNETVPLYSDSSDISEPRKISKGETLFLDYVEGSGTFGPFVVYVRWHTHPIGSF